MTLDIKMKIDCRFRDDQDDGDDFNLDVGGHADFWLSRGEVEELRDRLSDALQLYDHAAAILAPGAAEPE